MPADVSILTQKGNESKIGSNPNGEIVALHAPKGDQPKGLFPDRRGFGETGLCQLHFCSSIWAVIDLVVHRFLLQKEAPSSVKAPVLILGPIPSHRLSNVFESTIEVPPGKSFQKKNAIMN